MGTRTADCRKFTPNIFNKSKCSHCFRQREEHSAAALECNRASRKVSKCGYLFVAPDWDFNNPLYRTKRWQRRWFVLYDDGEFTYSVDEHPETVPQAIIDMTKVLEVTTAEDVTGHTNSIAITAPDRVTFVKGTCPEEAKWWLNILSAFPKTKSRHKRNATFPGGQATTILQSGIPPNNRNRHNSYHKDNITSDIISTTWDNETHQQTGMVVVVGSSMGQDENNKNAGNEITNRVYTDQPISSKSPPTRDKIHPENKAQVRIRNRNRTAPITTTTTTTIIPTSIQDQTESTSPCLLIEDVGRDEKLKDIANTLTNLSQITSNRWQTTTNSMLSTTSSSSTNSNMTNNQIPLDDTPTRDETDFHLIHQDFHKVVNLRPKSLPLASNTAPAIVSAIVKKLPPVVVSDNKSSPRQQLLQNKQKLQQQQQNHERGDPDGGCNLDDLSVNYLSKTSELRVNLPAEDLLNSKKGWLMKQDLRTCEWTKHWFTLRGAALFYYRDPVSEERGVLDGVLDVNSLTNVTELSVTRNYGFQLTTWDNRRIILSTVSTNSRNNWINVLRKAAGLQVEPKAVDDLPTELIIKDNTSDDLKSEIEKDFIKAQRNQDLIINSIAIHEPVPDTPTILTKAPTTPSTPITTKTVLFSSDEEYRTASEGGRRDSVDWGSPLSPSPPVPLSLFRPKDRLRSRSSSSNRLHKRSRSSPPSSRRSTVDSVGSDDLPLIHPVQEELNIDKELQIRLGTAEKERDMLREEAREREVRMSDLLNTLERTELELTARIHEVEEARDNLSRQLSDANSKAEKIVERLTIELDDNQKKIKDLEDRLSRGIEENESLYKKLREMEGCNSSSLSNLNRSRMKRVDSLSDLTSLNEIDPYTLERDVLADEYNELKSRFEKAVNEIKAMKKELKESQNEFDTLEISYAALRQDLERKEIEDRSQLQMMAERIQDLTLKYTNSERQVRTLKQKLAKSERRRSLSLKGKESVTISKELEDKVSELENKVDNLESEKIDKAKVEEKNAKRASSLLRRKSLESSGSTDSLQFMVRVNALEKRIENVSSKPILESSENKSQSSPKVSEHLVERLKCLEGVLVTSKDRIEQSLQQLQSLRSSRTRRSVSPITDRKDSFRFVERCLTEVIKIMRESCESCIVGQCSVSTGILLLPESNPIKLALIQLEAQLRTKLNDLLKQRRVLRERNELTSRKDMELLAERIAFESVCFGKLRDSITRAEDPTKFGEKQTRAEVAETSQLMSMLKVKLGGKCAFKPSGSLDILASVLARRLVLSSHLKNQNKTRDMPPVNPKVMDQLLRQQNEINLIAKRYKNNAMENLACGLAAETLSYISSNDSVQGAVQEAWRQAQEAVNAELVQSEIAHIMMRNAERFENSITPSFGYTLTTQERISFENFADAVHDVLRKEMDNAIGQLTRCYEDCLEKMKRGQWRLHLEQERKASEGRQLLSEFADIIAHKALVDARIAVLKGDHISKDLPIGENITFSITNLQKYENLFDELANDLQICNPDDILAEADFNFLYKHFTTEFLIDKPQLKDVTNSLAKLEESIVCLNSSLRPNDNSISKAAFEIETLKDVCLKCRELRNQVDGMTTSTQDILRPCEHCEKMQDSICNLAVQHETELQSLQKVHEKDTIVLKKQLEDHVNTIKSLENERNSLLEELSLQTNLVEDHERELTTITLKLKHKEEECYQKSEENLDLLERLENHEDHISELKDEKQKLINKSLHQNEEYSALLKERDYIQSELNRDRERSRKLEKRLEMLELEHTKQLECLQEAYRDQILSHCSDFTGIADEESFRQRYQTEIEQLRTLCEKGLAAMESSHRRIVHDLEEKHREEIERLLTEKEQALAEETQATLAALDAMRKAHQSEVQREVARFKQEFLRQFQKGDPSVVPIKEKEEELEELRQEILSFSEKYSIKCVENAALEERLRASNQKLKQFQQMQQFELRNKQFRAHLASEDNSDLNFVQGLASKEESPSPDSEHVFDEFNMSTETSYVDPTPPVTSTTTITTSNINIDHINNPLLVEHNCKNEFHPRSGFNEGIKLATIYSDVTNNNIATSMTTNPIPTRSFHDWKLSLINKRNDNKNYNNNNNNNNLRSPPPKNIDNQFSIDRRQHNDRFIDLTKQSEPVEQPKTLKVLSPKNLNNYNNNLISLNSINESSKIQQNDNDDDNDDHQGYDHHFVDRNDLIQTRLAVSINSLSELLNTNNNNNSISKYKNKNSISEMIINTNNNNNNNNNSIVSSTSNLNNKKCVIDHLKIIKNGGGGDSNNDTIENFNGVMDCRYDNNNCKSQLESSTTSKKCSPSSLSGRDVEHHHTTSHLRRFELEI